MRTFKYYVSVFIIFFLLGNCNELFAQIELIAPKNQTQFSPEELQKPITFQWTSIETAKDYRLQIWKVEPGDDPTRTVQSNLPVLSIDVMGKTQVTLNGIDRQLCTESKCQFVWTVRVLYDKEISRSPSKFLEPVLFSFFIPNEIDAQFDSIFVECCEDRIQSVSITIQNNLSNTIRITSLFIDQINGASSSITINGLSPTLPLIIPGNGSQQFTGYIECFSEIKTIRFRYTAEDVDEPIITETEVGSDTLDCPCDPCDELGVDITSDQLVLGSPTSDEITLQYVATGLDPNIIQRMNIELVYFTIEQTGDEDCAKCASNAQWGNFIPPATIHSGYNPPQLHGINFGRLWTWTSTINRLCGEEPEENGNIEDFSNGPEEEWLKNYNYRTLPISVPPGSPLECCADIIRLCIRYTWWDFCCRSCEEIRCYEITRP